MVRKAWVRHKKNARDPFDEHWITKLPPSPGSMYGICTEKRCEGWTPAVIVPCAYSVCTETYCGVCGRAGGSWGPVGCPCDGATSGHNTLAERPRARGKLIANPDEDSWNPFILVPFKKYKKLRGKK